MDKNKIEIKARHHSTDTGFCREIWQGRSMTGRTLWLMRDTMDGHWMYLSSGPGGCCEPESRIPGTIDILVCNDEWEAYYRTGNDRTRFPDGFPTFEQACKKYWDTIKDEHLPTVGTPELRTWLNEVKPGDLSYFDSINWDSTHYKAIDPEYLIEDGFFISREDKGGFKTAILLGFSYLGRDYHIVRKANHHTMCNARFYEYSVMKLVDGKFDGNYYWFGYGLINNR